MVLQKPGLPARMPCMNSILAYHLPGTCSGIADALAEIDNAMIPNANLVFFMSPSTVQSDRIGSGRFTEGGSFVHCGQNRSGIASSNHSISCTTRTRPPCRSLGCRSSCLSGTTSDHTIYQAPAPASPMRALRSTAQQCQRPI